MQTVLECIENCDVLADIGTDHAYLPIEACRVGFCQKAIACDILPRPLKMAEFNIKAAKLESRIETRMGDGLQPLLVNEADCITIAGMGGMRICGILSDAPKKAENAKLILQPQHDLEELRRFLHSNMYKIEESLVRERSRFYVIMVAQRGEVVPWTDAEYFLGKTSGADSTLYFHEMHKKISGYIHFITDEKMLELAKKRLAWLKEGINDNGTVAN